MDHPNPLITFDEFRRHVLRWYWYDLPENATDAERERFAADVENKIRNAWQERLNRIRNLLKCRMEELAWQHQHVEEQHERF